MADITGARGTGNITSTIRKTDMSSQVYELEPDVAPLALLTSKLNNKPTHNPEFKFVEDDLEPRFDAVDTTTGTGTTIQVDNASYFAEHDLVKVPRTGEVFRVTAVSSPNLTVVRGVGASAVAVANNDELIIIGSAQPEGDTSKPARSSNPTVQTGYTFIQRDPWESTETLRHSDTFIEPDDWGRMSAKKGIEHRKSIELAFWLSRASENTSGSQPRRTSNGVFASLSTNATDAGGALTEAELFTALRGPFRYGSRNAKTLFASALAVDVINGFPRGKLEIQQGEGTYGLNVRRLVSPHGTLNVVTHYLLEGSTYGGYAVILDMSMVKKRYLANSKGSRDTHIRDNIQANDADTMKSEYLTECGLEIGLEKASGYIYGITS